MARSSFGHRGEDIPPRLDGSNPGEARSGPQSKGEFRLGVTAAVTYFVFRTGLGAVCLLAGIEKVQSPATSSKAYVSTGSLRPALRLSSVARSSPPSSRSDCCSSPVSSPPSPRSARSSSSASSRPLGREPRAVEHGAVPLLRRLGGREDLAGRARPCARARRRGSRRPRLRAPGHRVDWPARASPLAADDGRLRFDHPPLGPLPARVVVPPAEGVDAPDAHAARELPPPTA